MYSTVSRNLVPRTSRAFQDLPRFRGNHRFDLFLPPSYLFGHTLGDGEFATVKLAYNLRTETYVAIKCFKPRSGQYMMLDEQIMRELMATKGLTHEHIVRTYEAILYGNRVFMVMEYCPYGDLRKYINRTGALAEVGARRFFGQLCLGVEKMHNLDLVHRDLKLENILIDQNFKLKIGDLGCARRQMDKQLHTVTGSYAYGAPELVRGDHYSGKKADMWSLGVILYAMVVGKLPYSDKGRLKKMIKDRMKLPDFPLNLSLQCCQILSGLLCFDPYNRLSLDEAMKHPWMHIGIETELGNS